MTVAIPQQLKNIEEQAIIEVLNQDMQELNSTIRFKVHGGMAQSMVLYRKLVSNEMDRISQSLKKMQKALQRKLWYTIETPSSDRLWIKIRSAPLNHRL